MFGVRDDALSILRRKLLDWLFGIFIHEVEHQLHLKPTCVSNKLHCARRSLIFLFSFFSPVSNFQSSTKGFQAYSFSACKIRYLLALKAKRLNLTSSCRGNISELKCAKLSENICRGRETETEKARNLFLD